jgi:hypothetical protein
MTIRDKTTLKTYFETDDVPLEDQFGDLIDSYPTIVTPSVADNFVSFLNINGEIKDSGFDASDFASGSHIHISASSVIKTVKKDGSGDYTTIQSAINAITDSGSGKIYYLYIYPGDYTELVVAKDYVHLVGVERGTTRILGPASQRGPIVDINATHTNLSNLTVLGNTVAWTFYTVKVRAGGSCDITNCYVSMQGGGGVANPCYTLWVTGANSQCRIYNSVIRISSYGADLGIKYAIYNNTTGSVQPACENSIIVATTYPGGSCVGIYNTYIFANPINSYIEGSIANSGSTGTAYAIYTTYLPSGDILPVGSTVIGNVYGGDRSDQFLQKSIFPVSGVYQNDTYVTNKNNSVFELTFQPRLATSVPLIAKGQTSQTADLQEWQDSSGSILGYFTSSGSLIIGTQQTYTPTNVTTDRTYDANATSTDELADVLGTLIADLQKIGLIK